MRSSLDPEGSPQCRLVLPHLLRIAVSACMHRPPPHLAWPLHVPLNLSMFVFVCPPHGVRCLMMFIQHIAQCSATPGSPCICLMNEPMEGVARPIPMHPACGHRTAATWPVCSVPSSCLSLLDSQLLTALLCPKCSKVLDFKL